MVNENGFMYDRDSYRSGFTSGILSDPAVTITLIMKCIF